MDTIDKWTLAVFMMGLMLIAIGLLYGLDKTAEKTAEKIENLKERVIVLETKVRLYHDNLNQN